MHALSLSLPTPSRLYISLHHFHLNCLSNFFSSLVCSKYSTSQLHKRAHSSLLLRRMRQKPKITALGSDDISYFTRHTDRMPLTIVTARRTYSYSTLPYSDIRENGAVIFIFRLSALAFTQLFQIHFVHHKRFKRALSNDIFRSCRCDLFRTIFFFVQTKLLPNYVRLFCAV